MATIGYLGDIPFTVSSELIQTPSNMKWAGTANYTEHSRVNGNALTEYTGVSADTFSFDLYLSATLGADPMALLSQLWKYERDGTPVSLVIGTHAYGKYKWTVQKHSVKVQYTDGAGNLSHVTVSVSLLEYLRS